VTDRVLLGELTREQLEALYSERDMLRRNLRRALGDAEIHAALHAQAEAAITRVRRAVSVRLADDECGEWERHGYHSALADVRRALEATHESTP
jgi:hypothetical protein